MALLKKPSAPAETVFKVMSRSDLSRQASDFLRASSPKRQWREIRKLSRDRKRQAMLDQLREQRATAARPKAEPPAYLYVVGCTDHPIKIGIAADVDARLRSLQTGFPYQLRVYFQAEVANARVVERECHRRLSAVRLVGEWFNCSPYEAINLAERVIADLGMAHA